MTYTMSDHFSGYLMMCLQLQYIYNVDCDIKMTFNKEQVRNLEEGIHAVFRSIILVFTWTD